MSRSSSLANPTLFISMLTISEELLLLMLDDETGWLSSRLPGHSIRTAISGALLMDLALADRIDTDLERLFLISAATVGEPFLDLVLERIRNDGEQRSTDYWIDVFSREHDAIRLLIDERLIARGVVVQDRYSRLLVIGVQRVVDSEGRPHRDARRRIADVLMGDEIPDSRDIMIISLVNTCALWSSLLDPVSYEGLIPRIRSIARLDLIGQSVARSISQRSESSIP